MERWWFPVLSGASALVIAVVMVIYRDGQNDAELQAALERIAVLEAGAAVHAPQLTWAEATLESVAETVTAQGREIDGLEKALHALDVRLSRLEAVREAGLE